MDGLIGTLDAMTKVGKNIGDEVDLHNNLLGDLDQGVEKNIRHIKKTNSKLDVLMQKSSNCCLFMIIFAEIVILVLILLYL
jgi:hypothetical protein